jgi:lipoprotein-releasing system permease protein
MFELSVARKYLIPRVRQLSVSVISLISVLVIACVVWLSIVFFSAQEGIERSWTEKMVAITSPIRLTPTRAYYKSYYYQIDSYAAKSNYAFKSLREKLNSPETDPYDVESDPTLPKQFPNNDSVDIVKSTMKALEAIPGSTSHIFETAQGTVHIRLIHDAYEQQISSNVFITSFDAASARLLKSATPPLHDSQNGIWLPKGFKEAGVKLGDEGYISYQGFGATATQEMRAKVVVTRFYDPGILPVGGKVVLVSDKIVSQILSAGFSDERSLPSGIGVEFQNLSDAHEIKDKIMSALQTKGLLQYWKVETYDEYDFSKEIFQQMRSDKNLFSLISVIITIVACSNIISMLIILVHDKRKEVAILRALGASKGSIMFIFGLSGFLLGAVGSCVGALLAIITLKNLHAILAFFGRLQGFEVLSSAYYANSLPSEVSMPSLLFVLAIAAVGSCLAGIVPAFQASRINTSEALRNE